MLGSALKPSGELQVRQIRGQRPPWGWRLRNALRWSFLWGWLANRLAGLFSRLTGIPTLVGQLALRVRQADGGWIDYGIVCYRLVTNAGVAYIINDLNNATGGADVTLFNFHGCGTGINAENVSDTALQAESTTVLNPDSTRATGSRSSPAANQYRTTGTLNFDGSAAITEHGIFTSATVGSGTLLDRSVFSAVNVVNGESIQFEYTFTVNSGG